MLNDFFHPEKVFIACGYTDLRLGNNLDPFRDVLFLFCGRRTDRIKGLYWDGDGFILLYKRLEQGSFQWPRKTEDARQITAQQYRWLMEGLKIDQPRANRPMNTVGYTVV